MPADIPGGDIDAGPDEVETAEPALAAPEKPTEDDTAETADATPTPADPPAGDVAGVEEEQDVAVVEQEEEEEEEEETAGGRADTADDGVPAVTVTDDATEADVAATAGDGTEPAAEEDKEVAAELEAAEDETSTDTMAATDDGIAPATEEDEEAAVEAGTTDDAAGTDAMAEAEDGAAPPPKRTKKLRPRPGPRGTQPAPTRWRQPTTKK